MFDLCGRPFSEAKRGDVLLTLIAIGSRRCLMVSQVNHLNCGHVIPRCIPLNPTFEVLNFSACGERVIPRVIARGSGSCEADCLFFRVFRLSHSAQAWKSFVRHVRSDERMAEAELLADLRLHVMPFLANPVLLGDPFAALGRQIELKLDGHREQLQVIGLTIELTGSMRLMLTGKIDQQEVRAIALTGASTDVIVEMQQSTSQSHHKVGTFSFV